MKEKNIQNTMGKSFFKNFWFFFKSEVKGFIVGLAGLTILNQLFTFIIIPDSESSVWIDFTLRMYGITSLLLIVLVLAFIVCLIKAAQLSIRQLINRLR